MARPAHRAAVLAAGLAAALSLASAAPITRLTDPLARCLDGTLSALYVEPAAAPVNATRFVIFLEGGGECASAGSCSAATSSVLGSAKYFPQQKTFDEGVFYASALSSNPFSGYTRVYLPYCSQDLHSGTRTVASPTTFGYYFAGHLIFRAVIDALVANHGFGAATEVILTGASAGGIGAWINVNYLTSRVPAAARVTIAPIAGMYFFAYPYAGVNHTSSELVDFREAAWPGNVALWASYIDPACAAGLGARSYACMLSNYSFPYIRAEAFVVEAQTDQVQLEAHDWLPGPDHQDAPERGYMTAWAANMTIALRPVPGFFNPACYIHTSFNAAGPLIAGMNYLQAFASYYAGGTVRLADSCGLTCNPTCAH